MTEASFGSSRRAMHAKGSALLSRKFFLERDYGPVRGREMFDAVVKAVPGLPAPILASTPIPMGLYLQFQEELLRRYFKNDSKAFFRFGEASAEWSLTEGPYRRILESRDLSFLAAQGAVLYRNFYDTGSSETFLEGDYVVQRTVGIPAPFRHVFIEYGTVGYFRRALEMLTDAAIRVECIRGFSKGDPDLYYKHVLTPRAPTPNQAPTPR